MKTPTPLQVSRKLHKSIRAAQANGWTLVRTWFLRPEQQQCCGLTTLTLTLKESTHHTDAIAEILNVNRNIVWSIVHGWDSCNGENDNPTAPEYLPEWFALGHRLAKKFIKE